MQPSGLRRGSRIANALSQISPRLPAKHVSYPATYPPKKVPVASPLRALVTVLLRQAHMQTLPNHNACSHRMFLARTIWGQHAGLHMSPNGTDFLQQGNGILLAPCKEAVRRLFEHSTLTPGKNSLLWMSRGRKQYLSHWGKDDRGTTQLSNNTEHPSLNGEDAKNCPTWGVCAAHTLPPQTCVQRQPADPVPYEGKRGLRPVQTNYVPYTIMGTSDPSISAPKGKPKVCTEWRTLGSTDNKAKVPGSTQVHKSQINLTLGTFLLTATKNKFCPNRPWSAGYRTTATSCALSISTGPCNQNRHHKLKASSAALSSSRPSIMNPCSFSEANTSSERPCACTEPSAPDRQQQAGRAHAPHLKPPQVHELHGSRSSSLASLQHEGLPLPSPQTRSDCSLVRSPAADWHALLQQFPHEQLPRAIEDQSGRLSMPGNKMSESDWDRWAPQGRNMRQRSHVTSTAEDPPKETSTICPFLSGEITLRHSIKVSSRVGLVRLLGCAHRLNRAVPPGPPTIDPTSLMTPGEYARHRMRWKDSSRWSRQEVQGLVWRRRNAWRTQWPGLTMETSQLLKEGGSSQRKGCAPPRWRSTSRRWTKYGLARGGLEASSSHRANSRKDRPCHAYPRRAERNSQHTRVPNLELCDQETATCKPQKVACSLRLILAAAIDLLAPVPHLNPCSQETATPYTQPKASRSQQPRLIIAASPRPSALNPHPRGQETASRHVQQTAGSGLAHTMLVAIKPLQQVHNLNPCGQETKAHHTPRHADCSPELTSATTISPMPRVPDINPCDRRLKLNTCRRKSTAAWSLPWQQQ